MQFYIINESNACQLNIQKPTKNLINFFFQKAIVLNAKIVGETVTSICTRSWTQLSNHPTEIYSSSPGWDWKSNSKINEEILYKFMTSRFNNYLQTWEPFKQNVLMWIIWFDSNMLNNIYVTNSFSFKYGIFNFLFNKFKWISSI